MNERRKFIKTSFLITMRMAAAPSFAFSILKSKPQGGKELIGHGDFRYRVYPQWGNLDSTKTPVKNCHEMWNAAQSYPVKLERV